MRQLQRVLAGTVGVVAFMAGSGLTAAAAPKAAPATFGVQLKQAGRVGLTLNGKPFALPKEIEGMKKALGAPGSYSEDPMSATGYHGYFGNGLQFSESMREPGYVGGSYLFFIDGELPTGLAGKGLKVAFDLPIKQGTPVEAVRKTLGKPVQETWETMIGNPARWGQIAYQRGDTSITFYFKDKKLAGIAIQ